MANLYRCPLCHGNVWEYLGDTDDMVREAQRHYLIVHNREIEREDIIAHAEELPDDQREARKLQRDEREEEEALEEKEAYQSGTRAASHTIGMD
jgi:hypothetical protein